MSNEWDANIQAIGASLERKDRRITELETLVDGAHLLERMSREQIADLEAKLIGRLAEINEKDRRIAELEETIYCMQPLRGLHI